RAVVRAIVDIDDFEPPKRRHHLAQRRHHGRNIGNLVARRQHDRKVRGPSCDRKSHVRNSAAIGRLVARVGALPPVSSGRMYVKRRAIDAVCTICNSFPYVCNLELDGDAVGELQECSGRLSEVSSSPYHSGAMPAALMRGHHFSTSAFCKAPSASGDCWSDGKISWPSSVSRVRTAGSIKAATTAALSLPTISLGVPFGAQRPCQ